jgi:HPt (histidine-containing phosphotransfer) domain-containing protein
MDDYLSKPLALKSLSATLARWAHATAKPALNHQPLIDGDHDAHSTELRCSTSAERAGSSDSVLDAQVVARLERLGEASGEDLLGQLASLFLADAEARIVSLRQAVAADDATAMRASAHTLSGASANLGATDLALLCANLATDGAAGNLEGSEAKVKAVEVELGRVRSALDLQATS